MIRSFLLCCVLATASAANAAQVDFIGTVDSRTVLFGVPGAGPLDPLPPSRTVNISVNPFDEPQANSAAITGTATFSGLPAFSFGGAGSNVIADGANLTFVMDFGGGFFGNIVFNGVTDTNITGLLLHQGTADAATFTHVQGGGTSALQYQGALSSVPEPSSAALLGICGLAAVLRRKRNA